MTSLTMRHRQPGKWPGGRRMGIAGLGLAVATIALPLAAFGAGRHGPVEIDLDALDALGPPATGGAGEQLRLRPPAAAKPADRAAGNASPSLHLVPQGGQPGSIAPAATANAAPSPAIAAAPASPAAAPPSPPKAQAALPPVPLPSAPLPPPSAPDRILFPAQAMQLTDEAKTALDAVAQRLAGNARLYLQLVAYAGGGSDASEARRVSLSRALAARGYLIDHGVEPKQVDVRPLGNKPEAGLPPDRVDLVVSER